VIDAGTGARMTALQPAGPQSAPLLPQPEARRWRRARVDRYSRRVALLKRVLPALGLALLLLVAAWPRLAPLLESVRRGFAAIDLREARELKMTNPRYGGVDRENRPYVVTAAVGHQIPNQNDLMSLDRPRAEIKLRPGATVVLTSATALYQSQAQLLDLFGDVDLTHENGTRFLTRRAHADLGDNSADGHEPVAGHGPWGDITAQGFRIRDKGDTIFFTGSSYLVLNGPRPSKPGRLPPSLPEAVEQTAAAVEAAAVAAPVVASPPPPAAKPAPASPPPTQSRTKPKHGPGGHGKAKAAAPKGGPHGR
jgi:lipopolysaccharide export system protein LptC